MSADGASPARWERQHWLGLVAAFIVGIAIRVLLLPTEGLRGDIDEFARWIAHISSDGLVNAYDEDLSFPPVMAYVWAALGAVEPAFRSVVDASDAGLRSLMKVPASLADLGLAAAVAFGLRSRPTLAVIGAVAILLHPAVWYVSAWWGQYESIYALSALVAVLFAINGRDGWAAAALAVAVMTKPQAVPLLLPFAAWFLARGGPVGLARAAAIGLGVIVVLWLPFLAAGGPANYLRNLATYQNDIFAVLSLRAWNVWWLVQEAGAGGNFVADQTAVIGPITFRHIGYGMAGLISAGVAYRVWRHPQPRTLVLALAAASLVAFTFLTTMHERYAYATLVFLMLLIDDVRVRWLAIAFGVVFTLNLLAAVPPNQVPGSLVPLAGPVGVLGSLTMTIVAAVTVGLTVRANGKGNLRTEGEA